jgi:hypothetical protein
MNSARRISPGWMGEGVSLIWAWCMFQFYSTDLEWSPIRIMNFASIQGVWQTGFLGGVAVYSLQASGCREVPDAPGVYLVLRPDGASPDFLSVGTGARYKGRDSNVAVAILQKKWVDGAIVLNIGKAGGTNTATTLRGRLNKYVRFGQGSNSGHSGGRYIWQLRDSRDLLVFWKPAPDCLPRAIERELLREFKGQHHQLPFANLRG